MNLAVDLIEVKALHVIKLSNIGLLNNSLCGKSNLTICIFLDGEGENPQADN